MNEWGEVYSLVDSSASEPHVSVHQLTDEWDTASDHILVESTIC